MSKSNQLRYWPNTALDNVERRLDAVSRRVRLALAIGVAGVSALGVAVLARQSSDFPANPPNIIETVVDDVFDPDPDLVSQGKTSE